MPSRPSHRSLLPREHGAYAQLAAPLVAALLVRAPTVAALLLAVGAICAFLANEPLLVLLGHRGRRRLETERYRAHSRLTWLGSVALVAGASGLVLGGPRVIGAAAIVAVPALALVLFACQRAQHSAGGELLAAMALPGLAVPVAVASEVSIVDALLVWSAWTVGYAASVVAVHRVIARHRRAATAVDWMVATSLVGATIGAALLARSSSVALVALPLLACTTLLVLHPPRATRLRAIGVALAAMSAVSTWLAMAAL